MFIIFYCLFFLLGVNCLAYDEAIIAQQDRIQQEVSDHIYHFIHISDFLQFFLMMHAIHQYVNKS